MSGDNTNQPSSFTTAGRYHVAIGRKSGQSGFCGARLATGYSYPPCW